MKIGLIDIPSVPFVQPKKFEQLNALKCQLEDDWAEHRLNISMERYAHRSFSIGLLSIATILKNNGHEILYSHYQDKKRLKEIINNCQFIGISSMSPFLSIVDKIANKIKKEDHKKFIVVGGPGPSNEPNLFLDNCKNIDVVVIGEGEKTVLELSKNFKNLNKINGIGYRNNSQNIFTKPREYIKGKEIPIPDYSILPHKLESYILDITSMRGCPYNCAFCAKFKGPVRFRPINDLIKELNYLNKKLSPHTPIQFSDNIISIGGNRFFEMMEKISQQNYDLVFFCDIRANHVNSKIIKSLDKANFKRINIGIEDASNQVLKKIDKGLTFKIIKQAIKTIRDNSDALIGAYWMIALPSSNDKSINKNLKIIEKMILEQKLDFILPSLMKPYPGSKITAEPEKYNIRLINSWKDWLNNYYLPIWESNDFSEKKLIKLNLKYIKTTIAAYKKRYNKVSHTKNIFKNKVSI